MFTKIKNHAKITENHAFHDLMSYCRTLVAVGRYNTIASSKSLYLVT